MRQLILRAIVQGVQQLVPGFGVRRMRYADFLKACEREGLQLRPPAKEYHYDGLRSGDWSPPAIRLRVDLAEPYRTFVAFHELAHWVAHPHHQATNLERGVLGYVEREAMDIGYLACGLTAGARRGRWWRGPASRSARGSWW